MARSYLPKEKRREMFLETASAIVDSQGWDALSMISLAETAGVSRQLVYQHFDSIDQLLELTATHMFEDLYQRTRDALTANIEDIAAALRLAQRITFEMPDGRAKALWSIIVAGHPDDSGIARVGRRFRRILSQLWAPMIGQSLGLKKKPAEHVSWMLIMAFWGAHQLVDDKQLSRNQAMETVTWLVTRVVQGGDPVARKSIKPQRRPSAK